MGRSVCFLTFEIGCIRYVYCVRKKRKKIVIKWLNRKLFHPLKFKLGSSPSPPFGQKLFDSCAIYCTGCTVVQCIVQGVQKELCITDLSKKAQFSFFCNQGLYLKGVQYTSLFIYTDNSFFDILNAPLLSESPLNDFTGISNFSYFLYFKLILS